jgi:hypothetical protein
VAAFPLQAVADEDRRHDQLKECAAEELDELADGQEDQTG